MKLVACELVACSYLCTVRHNVPKELQTNKRNVINEDLTPMILTFLAAVLLGLLAGFYMLKWLNKVEEQPVESMQHSPAEMTQIAKC